MSAEAGPRRVLLLFSYEREFSHYTFSRLFRPALARSSPDPIDFIERVVGDARQGCRVGAVDLEDRLVESRLSTLDPFSSEGRRIQRHFFSGAAETELDKQGRVMVPRELMQHAKLSREVVVAGVNDRLEIWDRDTWRNELAQVEGSAEDAAERLADKRD